MARYAEQFVGMRARFSRPEGSDPNYRGGYNGMRMEGPPGRARYGSHRRMHQRDLGGFDGYSGIHSGRPSQGYQVDYDRRGYMGYPNRGPRLIGEFNSRSRALEIGEGDRGYGRDFSPRYRPDPQRGRYRPSYANRGMGEAGFSEDWGPFRPGIRR